MKVRDKFTKAESTLEINATGMTDDQCLKHVESLPGPAGTEPRNEVVQIVRVGGLHEHDFVPEPVVVYPKAAKSEVAVA